MTMHNIHSHSEYARRTTTSKSANFVGQRASTTGSDGGKVIYFSFPSPPNDLPPRFTSIDDYVNTLERDDASADQLREARKDFALQFLGQQSETIRSLRLKRGLSQAQLALAIRSSQSQVVRLEAGKHDPTYDTFAKLAVAFEVDIAAVVHAFGNGRAERDAAQAEQA